MPKKAASSTPATAKAPTSTWPMPSTASYPRASPEPTASSPTSSVSPRPQPPPKITPPKNKRPRRVQSSKQCSPERDGSPWLYNLRGDRGVEFRHRNKRIGNRTGAPGLDFETWDPPRRVRFEPRDVTTGQHRSF